MHSNGHMKATARGAWGLATRLRSGPRRREGVKISLLDIGASFERRVCSIEVKWASVEENVSTLLYFLRAT